MKKLLRTNCTNVCKKFLKLLHNYRLVLRSFDQLFLEGIGIFFYFKDNRVSKTAFTAEHVYFSEIIENTSPPTSYQVGIVEFSSSIKAHLTLYIRADDPTNYSGLFLMPFDYELPDDVCMFLYEQDIDIAYKMMKRDKNFTDPVTVYYERHVIERRQTIERIIES